MTPVNTCSQWIGVFVLGLLSLTALSQPLISTSFCGSTPVADYHPQWRCLGPEGQPAGSGSHIGNGQMNGVRFDPRYHAVAPDSQGYGRMYAFSPTGGLWRSENEGVNWEVIAAVDTQLPAINVADLAVSPHNPEVLFLATGDGDHSYRLVFEPYRGVVVNTLFSSGVYRSVDDGQSWERIAVPGTFTCAEPLGMQLVRLEASPDYPNMLFALSPKHGLWRTRNALAPADEVEWEQVLKEQAPFESGSGWRGLALVPGVAGRMYAAGRRVYESNDSGSTWQPLPGFDPDSLWNAPSDDDFCEKAQLNCPAVYDALCGDGEHIPRQLKVLVCNLAVTPAAPGRLYAYLLAEETYRKTTLGAGRGESRCRDFGKEERRMILQVRMWDGQSWHLLTEGTEWGLAASRMAIAVSPVDSNEICYGVVNLNGTVAGVTDSTLIEGSAFQTLARSRQQGFHVDVHALSFEPNTPTPRLLIAHDGGLSWRDDAGQFEFCNDGLATNLVWTFDHFERPDGHLEAVIGTQDCGTMILQTDAETGKPVWLSIGGGDGYGARIDQGSGLVFLHENYSTSRYDAFTGQRTREVSSKLNGDRTIDDLRPLDPVTGDKAWVPNTFRLINHPLTGTMIWGLTELYERSEAIPAAGTARNPGSLWHPLTDAGKRLPEQWKRRIWEFDLCQSDPDIMYFAWSGLPEHGIPAAIFRTVRSGCDSVHLQSSDLRCVEEIPFQGFPKEGPTGIDFPIITGIAVHPGNPDKFWVTFAGYQPDYKVWSWTRIAGTEGGGIWKDEASATLHNLPVNGIVCQGGPLERLYIATDAGVYVKEKGMSAWVKYGSLPNVRCTELDIHHCSGTLRVATFGRGLWEGDLLPLPNPHELVIDDQQVWVIPRSLSGNLRIAHGGKLTVRTTVGMPKGGQLLVDPGGKLVIEAGGDVLNACGHPWEGIIPVKRRTFWEWLLGKKADVVATQVK